MHRRERSPGCRLRGPGRCPCRVLGDTPADDDLVHDGCALPDVGAHDGPAAPTTTTTPSTSPRITALPIPDPLAPFAAPASSGEGVWTPSGRTVEGVPAVYETSLVPPGGAAAAGLAWMDTRLLAAQLYSGSKSPGGGPYTLTAPVEPTQAASLVAAFNGGFLMQDAQGGYYTQGRAVFPLVEVPHPW